MRISNQWAAMVGGFVLLVGAAMAWFAGWNGGLSFGDPIANLVSVFLPGAGLAMLWLVAAWGFGWPLRRLLVARDAGSAPSLQACMGVAVLLWLDGAAGSLGVLQAGGAVGAWVLTAVGVVLACWQGVLASQRRAAEDGKPMRPPFEWLIASPAVAVLLVAACSAPGWLWASEFAGYDALSYHLQLPKEWAQLGGIQPLEHNVYSFLPSAAEGAYYHLHVLAGGAPTWLYASQLLHACITLASVVICAHLVRAIGIASIPASFAGVLMLGVPWVIVVGSLAYNEMFTVLFLLGGLLLVAEPHQPSWRTGAVAGMCAGAACTAKLTAVGFVAVPIAILLLFEHRRGIAKVFPLVLAGGVCAAVIALPWLVRNWVHAGNPIFPFAADTLGHAHWTAEQVQHWKQGHSFDGSPADRISAIWHQLFRFGIGPAPAGFEDVWLPQWSVLFLLAAAGGVTAFVLRAQQRWMVRFAVIILLQLMFWLTFTHLKSRFMLPAVVPCVGLVMIGWAALVQRIQGKAIKLIVIVVSMLVACGWALQPVLGLHKEASGAPLVQLGADFALTGDGLDDASQRVLADQRPSVFVNTQLPSDARVLLVGEATPLYYELDTVYATVWDRGPMSAARAMHGHDGPDVWRALRETGFTHVLIHGIMLENWAANGWGDPDLTANQLIAAADRECELIKTWQDGAVRLYRLPQ